jgi:Family of unknown function (DUF6440)
MDGKPTMMRTTLVLGVTGAVMLAGCDQTGSPFQSEPIKTTKLEGKIRGTRSGGEQVRVWRDPATGCQYLLWERSRQGGMTPRLTREGRPMCGADTSANLAARERPDQPQ